MKLRWSETSIPKPDKKDYKDWEPFWVAYTKYRNSFVYEAKCKECNTVNRVYTQEDGSPEYYTDVFIECRKCEAKVWFSLPVN